MITLNKKQMNSPCVYRVIQGQDVLYVGYGASGMSRIFDVSISQKGRTKAFDDCTEVCVESFVDKAEAAKHEAQLIHELHPIGNGYCPKCRHYVKDHPERLQGRGVFFGKTRHAILALLLEHPEKAYSIREIERAVGICVGAVHREVTNLTKASILRRVLMGKSVYYEAETNSPFFHEMQSMVLKGA